MHTLMLALMEANEVPIMGGFIAANRSGETTVLGRGGSDYSAALVAAAMGATELQIWTDVTGVMTCDPRICGEARTIPILSYEEAAELAYFGAKVLHSKTIKPAVDHGIPVRVCNTFGPETVGTMVLADSGEAPNKIKSIAHKKNITILRISSARMLGSYGFMSAVFQVFERFRTVIDVISTSEVSIALTLDNTTEIDKIVTELERLGDVEVDPGCAPASMASMKPPFLKGPSPVGCLGRRPSGLIQTLSALREHSGRAAQRLDGALAVVAIHLEEARFSERAAPERDAEELLLGDHADGARDRAVDHRHVEEALVDRHHDEGLVGGHFVEPARDEVDVGRLADGFAPPAHPAIDVLAGELAEAGLDDGR